MSTVHSNTADAFTPEDFGVLVNLAVQAKSIAANSATVFGTDKHKVNFPLWESDPAVGWYNELDEIVAADGTTGEVECIPSKTAGITRISNELRDDTDPAVADIIGAALANKDRPEHRRGLLRRYHREGPERASEHRVHHGGHPVPA